MRARKRKERKENREIPKCYCVLNNWRTEKKTKNILFKGLFDVIGLCMLFGGGREKENNERNWKNNNKRTLSLEKEREKIEKHIEINNHIFEVG